MKCRKSGTKEHVAEPQGGARVVDRRTRAAGERSQHSLTSRGSVIREIRARELDVETREATSSERC
jgi:hypothetical protein